MTSKNETITQKRDDNPGSLARESFRLLAAAVNARDALRSEILPGLDRLARLAAENPEAVAVIAELRTTSGAHADHLRIAVKDRPQRRIRRTDLPCWQMNG